MKFHNLTARFAQISLTVLLLCTATTLAQTSKRELTLEWIYGPEGRAVASVPTSAWLDDGTLVILDNRHPPNERTFEKLNPATNERRALVDSTRALADLKRAAGVNETSCRGRSLSMDQAHKRFTFSTATSSFSN